MKRVELILEPGIAGERLDVVVARALPEHSRRSIRDLIERGHVFVDGKRVKVASRPVNAGARLIIHDPGLAPAAAPTFPPLVRLYEDEDLIVVDKPPGLHLNETETSAQLAVVELLRAEGESAFVVHRLDRETSGVVLLAKTKSVAADLGEEFRARRVEKLYWAIVSGPVEDELIDLPIGPDRRRPRARTVRSDGKASTTEVRSVSSLDPLRLVEARPRTGRTHQIRVHLAQRGAPLFGDRLYGGLSAVRVGSEVVRADRVMLHARSLRVALGGVMRSFEAPPPEDFLGLARLGLALPGLSK